MDNNITDNYLCDEVLINLRRIIQTIELHSRQIVRKIGLTGPQLLILLAISKGKELTVGEIAKSISLGQATVTSILTRLEKKGLITRERSIVDKRKVYIKITQQTERLLKIAPPPLQETFIKQFNELKNWEQSMILCSLQRLVNMMEAKEIDAAPYLETGPLE